MPHYINQVRGAQHAQSQSHTVSSQRDQRLGPDSRAGDTYNGAADKKYDNAQDAHRAAFLRRGESRPHQYMSGGPTRGNPPALKMADKHAKKAAAKERNQANREARDEALRHVGVQKPGHGNNAARSAKYPGVKMS